MKKTLKIRLIIYIVSASFLTAAAVFALSVYSAWRNPAGVFIEEALATANDDEAAETQQAKEMQGAESIAPDQKTEDQKIECEEFASEKVVNIVLLGIDSNQSTVERNKGWRSDMVMLCTVNMQNNSIALTTIPRDTQTSVYHVDKDGNATQKELTKINHAYSYGGGPDKYGAQNAMLAVGDFLSESTGMNIPIQYYISIDLENVPKLADAFGGIPVELDVNFPELGKKGDTVVINSTNVYQYLRNRYDVGGDLARARHHEEFLLSMMKEFKDKGGVRSVTGLVSYAMQYTRTDLSFQQVIALSSILDQSDLGNLDYKVIDGEYQYIDGICYYLSDAQDVKNRMNALMR